jgi:hypothetical protein
MKITSILFLLLMSIGYVKGQNIKLLNTKDLINIAENYGLDSAIITAKGIPIYYIDKPTSVALIKKIPNQKSSDRIENFLVDYFLHENNKDLSYILYDYFDKKKNEIKDCTPDRFNHLPKISEEALITLMDNCSTKTDSLLYTYYQLWNEKSNNYKGSPFEDCNFNCYRILLALDSMKSKFFDQEKLDKHRENLVYYLRDGFSFGNSFNVMSDYNKYNDQYLYKSLKLKRIYNSFTDIVSNNEPEFQNLISEYDKSDCWKFIMFNGKIGYLDIGRQSGPLDGDGAFYRLEINGDTLNVYLLYTWIS